MKFRTEIDRFSLPFTIELNDSLFFMGSCFADNLSIRFSKQKFKVSSNPFGTLFNPLSISTALYHIATKQSYSNTSQVQNQGVYYSWLHNGSVAALTEEELLKKTNSINQDSYIQLKNCKYLFITLGSAWAYVHKETATLVANCHKVPANQFEKIFYTTQDILSQFDESLKAIKKINSSVNVLFTVSPVRHTKDGLIENNRSKSELIQAVHALCDQNDFCHYLPVYEWVIDDLRDYRFFEKDLVHPNKTAQDYVWEKLCELFFTNDTEDQLKQLKNFLSGLEHRPLNCKTKEHQLFLNALFEKGESLQREIKVDLKKELLILQEQIDNKL